MSLAKVFEQLPNAIDADAIDGLECTLQLNLSTPTVVKIDEGVCNIEPGVVEGADVELTLSDENFIELVTGKLDAVMAYMSGKVKIEGDLALAKEFTGFFDSAAITG